MSARLLGALVLAAAVLAGCSEDPPARDSDRVVLSPADEAGHTHSGTGADAPPVGTGTTPEAGGYRLELVGELPEPGRPGDVSFRVLDRSGRAVTTYVPDQTKDLHMYVVRSDLAHFRHLHPTMAPDGTWTGRVALPTAGSYRVIVEFLPAEDPDAGHVVLGDTALVPGTWTPEAVADAASADDGVVAVEAPETLAAGSDERMTLTVSGADGDRVALGSYLGTFAHLTGFHAGSGRFVHVHPYGAAEPAGEGDELTFHTEFTEPGRYRFFLQVRVDGFLHQVPFTATVS
ncbi:hypothetical protein [Nocardioides sp. cx-173]|uniref:hypothetical protein n=1 Tax=Nocardioides sp. cx-173 TaxID=2898796 RepID=UPI001E3FBE28|nr:hypothetical protein [Nocardioides sp. cx-173]MCD4524462.1 hypothetical protein [Nocardioides sp. cx-173]UGB43052.1 hypothetical protein LQ940_05885 [Nocardioides sp. cx-173]